MKKCKCIKEFESGTQLIKFELNGFYKYDYIPSANDRPPFFRVYDNENSKFEDISFSHFKDHFKKY